MNFSKKIILFSLAVFAVSICTTYVRNKFPSESIPDTINPATERTSATSVPSPSGTNRSPEISDKFHTWSVDPDIPLAQIMADKGYNSDDNVNIYVDIKSRTLIFRYSDEDLKKYRISTGPNTDLGDKEKEGDNRTPRGNFYICSKDVYSPPKGYLGSRWMLLSYPNIEAAERGLDSGLIDEKTYNKVKSANLNKRVPPQNTILGSAIGIHGGAKKNLRKDWTAGCVGMYDKDVDEIFEFVKIGTSVFIE